MNILVLNGSPKGQYSITLQTINYLQKLHPEHTFEILHVGQRIKVLDYRTASSYTGTSYLLRPEPHWWKA